MNNNNNNRRRTYDQLFDDEDDIHAAAEYEWVERRSRRQTTYEYRGTALTPAQVIDRDTYYAYATIAFVQGMRLYHLVLLHLVMYRHLQQNITVMMGSVMPSIIAAMHGKMESIKSLAVDLIMILRFTLAYGEICYLHVEDLSFVLRRRHRFHEPMHRFLVDISEVDCYVWFGLNRANMRRVFQYGRIPGRLTHPTNGSVYPGETCFLVWLYRLRKGLPFTEMARFVFGGDPRRLSEMCDLWTDYWYNLFYNKITGDSLAQWIPNKLELCCRLIFRSLSDAVIEELTLDNGVVVNTQYIRHTFDFESFRIFGFIDDFAMPTARPGGWATRVYDFLVDIQRAFYSGYFGCHGYKLQIVFLPIGLIGSVFITEIRQNDNGVQNMSGLNDYLVRLLQGRLVGGRFPCVYADGIFRALLTIMPRYTRPDRTIEQCYVNLKMAGERQCIEHCFGDHRTKFRLFSMPHTLRIYSGGEKVRKLCVLSFFMLNIYYCLDGTRAAYFGHHVPTLAEYLPLHEILHPPPAVDLGDIFDFHNVL